MCPLGRAGSSPAPGTTLFPIFYFYLYFLRHSARNFLVLQLPVIQIF
jgi:hypothetical protein